MKFKSVVLLKKNAKVQLFVPNFSVKSTLFSTEPPPFPRIHRVFVVRVILKTICESNVRLWCAILSSKLDKREIKTKLCLFWARLGSESTALLPTMIKSKKFKQEYEKTVIHCPSERKTASESWG